MITLGPANNQIEFVERHENPPLGGKVALRALFYNDGQLVDPVGVSSVALYKYDTYSSSSILDASNLPSGRPLMQFAPSANEFGVRAAPADAVDYNEDWGAHFTTHPADFAYASGIFKLGTGDYVVPLRLDKGLSGNFENNTLDASANITLATNYIDVWVVKLLPGSEYQSLIHRWILHEDTFYSVTEPLIVKTSTQLTNKRLRYGEIIDLKAPVEVTIENRNIDQSIINILKTTLITSPALKITKVNDNTSLDGPFTVADFADTSGSINTTSDGTIIYKWDTTTIPTSVNFGEAKGTYAVEVMYWANGQKNISPRFYVSVD